ncbi:hypothetical protein, partial [Pseudomonas syringae]|uniref:hypothetical protein n=1 Tax=Pseudomonas syringae TaxID=317 RepID=UPI001C8260AD
MIASHSTSCQRLQHVAQRRFKHGRTRSLPLFPASYGFGILSDALGDFALGKTASCLLKQFKRLGMCHFFL